MFSYLIEIPNDFLLDRLKNSTPSHVYSYKCNFHISKRGGVMLQMNYIMKYPGSQLFSIMIFSFDLRNC